jgi:hypothetical protein
MAACCLMAGALSSKSRSSSFSGSCRESTFAFISEESPLITHQFNIRKSLAITFVTETRSRLYSLGTVVETDYFEELQHHQVCVATHPSHPRARAHRAGLEQVAKERLVAFTLADYPEHQAWIADLFAPLNRSPQIVEEHDSITSLIAAVESGRGIAVIAQPLNGLASPRLKIRPLQPPPPPLAVGIAYRKKSRSKTTDNFIEAAQRAKVD